MSLVSVLTLSELSDLERRYNGPIPEQAIADTIRMRPARDAKYLTRKIEDAIQEAAWHATELEGARRHDMEWETNYHTRMLAMKTREVARLRVELEETAPLMQAAQ